MVAINGWVTTIVLVFSVSVPNILILEWTFLLIKTPTELLIVPVTLLSILVAVGYRLRICLLRPDIMTVLVLVLPVPTVFPMATTFPMTNGSFVVRPILCRLLIDPSLVGGARPPKNGSLVVLTLTVMVKVLELPITVTPLWTILTPYGPMAGTFSLLVPPTVPAVVITIPSLALLLAKVVTLDVV